VAAGIGEFFDQLASRSPLWRLTAHQRRRLTLAVAGALATGWTPGALAEFAGRNTAGIRNPGALLTARLSPGELPPPAPNAARRRPWCGECDEVTRMLDYHGDAPRPRPRRKGSTKQAIVLHAGQRPTAPPQTGKRDLQR
jgi:hypothetical protein